MSRKNRRYKARVKRRQKLDKQRMKAELKLQKLEEKEERKRKKVMEKEERHRRKQEKREQKKGKKTPSVRERNRVLPQDQRRRLRKKRNRKKRDSQRRKPLLTVKWGVMVSAVCRIGRILRPFDFMISIISLHRMRTRTLFLKTGVIFSITSTAPSISNCLLSTIRAA